jgi:hypothetical protein
MATQKAAEPAVDEVDDLIDELQPGAKLLKGQYTITSYLNSGGFGITYLAKDSLDRDVVIKECFPSSVCRRSKVMVAARSRAHTAELRSVIQLFVREARNLAKIVHPNIVSVHNVFEDNGTAYMALDYIDGLDLQQIIDGEGERLAPEQIVDVTTKLIKAVGFIHENDMLHRDISPDNVLINKSGEPILIDFGAAREKASQTNRAMSALRVVKDGYSPQEFYIAGSEQGPWSDLYALGATMYHLISDEAPVNGQARLGALAEDRPDPYQPLTGRFEGYPVGFLEAIDRVMNTLPKQRLQSSQEWLDMFEGNAIAATVLVEPPVELAVEPAVETAPGTEDAVQRLVSDFQREEARIEATAAAALPTPVAKAPSQVMAAAPTLAKRGKGVAQLLAGVVVAVLAVGGGYMVLGKFPAALDTSAGIDAATLTPATGSTGDAVAANETPAPTAAETTSTEVSPVAEPASETTSAEVAPVADPAAETASTEGAAPAPVEPDPAPAETATVEPTPDTSSVAPAATETAVAVVEEPAPVIPPAPAGRPAEIQVGFAAWDAELPFMADDRIIGGQPMTIVLRLSPTVDLAEAGDWLQQGLLITGVNGKPTPTATALTAEILNQMTVDPDGKARVFVEYSGSDLAKKTGLLTVGVVRLVSLTNGVSVRTTVIDETWTSTVIGVAKPEVTTLREGDILFRDKTTGTALDTPEALETVMRDLVSAGKTQTEFSIIRDKKVGSAVLQLALDEAQ